MRQLIFIFSLLSIFSIQPFFAQEEGDDDVVKDHKYYKEHWDNFRERDGAVYNFSFCVPEEYITFVKGNRDSKFMSGVGVKYNLDYAAKYEVFQILEEEIEKKTGKKIIVPDPLQEPLALGNYPSNFACSFNGFQELPGWMFKKFLKYDTEAGYLLDVKVSISDKGSLWPAYKGIKIKPMCTIVITAYDREKNRLGKWSYSKKDFGKSKITQSQNKVYDGLLRTTWNVTYSDALSPSDIVGFFVATIEEMFETVDFQLN